MTSRELNDDALSRLDEEAHRLCTRYVNEVVLRFGLCPWAHRALVERKVQISVITDKISTQHEFIHVARILSELLEQLPQSCELLLVPLPRWQLDRLELDSLLRCLRSDVPLLAGRSEDTFAAAAFHPDAHEDRQDPERLIPYLRRSPDPTLQLTRTRVLDALEDGEQRGTSFLSIAALDWTGERPTLRSLRARVAEANYNALEGPRLEEYERLVVEIIEDRRRSYSRICSGS